MSKIIFEKNPSKVFDGQFSQIGKHQVRLVFNDEIPENELLLSGFNLINEHNGIVQTVRTSYTYIYRTYSDNKNQIELCKYVIEKNPKLINIKNNELNTPLHLAVFYNNYEIAKLLLERGAKVNEKNIMKITPLVLSHKLKHPQMEGLIYKYLIMTLHNNK